MVAVTGGGGGIGSAIAEELGRTGWFVVTVDPLVTLEGTARLADVGETTADRIVAAGGSAKSSSASVTDGPALRALFGDLAKEHGGLDAVVNVAGITRQSYVARGTEEDWLALLDVHLNGYLNVLEAALPLMAAAGHGRILGITSGSGWRAADAGGYSAAKRVVASLTWQLGRIAPPGVTINALSPIANTRMVKAAFERAQKAGHTGGGGGLTLDSMPGPEDVGPLGAHVVGDDFGWCTGQILFAGGPEVAVVDQPRLVEAIRTHDTASLAAVLDTVVPRAFVAAEAKQTSDGGANPRFGGIFDAPAPTESTPGAVHACALVCDRPDLATALQAALRDAPSPAFPWKLPTASKPLPSPCTRQSAAAHRSTPWSSPWKATRVPRPLSKDGSTRWPTTEVSSNPCTTMPRGCGLPPTTRRAASSPCASCS